MTLKFAALHCNDFLNHSQKYALIERLILLFLHILRYSIVCNNSEHVSRPFQIDSKYPIVIMNFVALRRCKLQNDLSSPEYPYFGSFRFSKGFESPNLRFGSIRTSAIRISQPSNHGQPYFDRPPSHPPPANFPRHPGGID